MTDRRQFSAACLTFLQRAGWLALAGALANGCSPDGPAGPLGGRPAVAQVVVAPNTYNALSLVVSAHVDGADSARLVYSSVNESERATPYVAVRGSEVQLVALGLRRSTNYALAVEAWSARSPATVRSDAVAGMTGEPPAAIGSLRVAASGPPTAGYTLVVPLFGSAVAGAYVVAFDGSGELRWYRAFDGDGWAVEAKQQPNGHFTAYVGRSYGWQPNAGHFVEFLPSGEVVRTYNAGAGSYTDPHELLLSVSGTQVVAAHMLRYDIRPIDLSSFGIANARLAVHSIVRQGADGSTAFAWDAGALVSPADWPARIPDPLDLDHPSSLAIDRDGNYVLSFQALDEITAINSRSGAVLWRFGGRHNEFAIEGDPLGGFHGQHSVRQLPNGNLLLFDNHIRSTTAASRAVEYALDLPARTARMVWEYRPTPTAFSPVMGSVQRLAGGNTLIGFGVTGRIAEVTADGRAAWSGALVEGSAMTPVQLYRAIRVASLYGYQAP